MNTLAKASSRGPRLLRSLTLVVLAGVSTVAAYLGWLRWHDRDYYYDADVGAAQGPYHPYQVVGLALTLALVAAVGGWLRRPWLTILVMTVVLVVVWSLDASWDPGPDGGANLWPVGALFLGVGSVLGLGVAAAIGRGARALADLSPVRKNRTVKVT
jgi:hypothetical protein